MNQTRKRRMAETTEEKREEKTEQAVEHKVYRMKHTRKLLTY